MPKSGSGRIASAQRVGYTAAMRVFLLGLFCLMGAGPAAKPSPPPTSSMPAKRPPDPVVGENLYRQSCWMCHGELGKGDGPAAAAMVGGVPSLEGKIKEEDFDALIAVILNGRGKMPAFSETIERPDSRRILVYLRDRMDGKPAPSTVDKPEAAEKEEGEGPAQ